MELLLTFDHQGNMDDWLIIEKIKDVVVGTSVLYNYEKSRPRMKSRQSIIYQLNNR